MSNNWNMESLRRVAGLPLNEANTQQATKLDERWDEMDDDNFDEDPDVKIASGDKRQKEFETRNKGELSAAQKAMAERNKAQKAAAAAKKAEAAKEQPKKEAPASKPAAAKDSVADKADKPPVKDEKPAEEKKEEAAAEAKRRGAKPNANSKAQRAVAWIKSNPSGTRGQFLKWAKENLEMGAAYGSAFFARHNPKSGRAPKVTNEAWVLTHPSMPSFLLAENFEMNRMQWIDPQSPMEPLVFESEAEANKVARYMSEWKSQHAVVEHIKFEQ